MAFTHSPTHSLIRLFTHSFIHSLMQFALFAARAVRHVQRDPTPSPSLLTDSSSPSDHSPLPLHLQRELKTIIKQNRREGKRREENRAERSTDSDQFIFTSFAAHSESRCRRNKVERRREEKE